MGSGAASHTSTRSYGAALYNHGRHSAPALLVRESVIGQIKEAMESHLSSAAERLLAYSSPDGAAQLVKKGLVGQIKLAIDAVVVTTPVRDDAHAPRRAGRRVRGIVLVFVVDLLFDSTPSSEQYEAALLNAYDQAMDGM